MYCADEKGRETHDIIAQTYSLEWVIEKFWGYTIYRLFSFVCESFGLYCLH